MTLFPSFVRSEWTLIQALSRSARVAVAMFFFAGLAEGLFMPFFAIWAQREGGTATAYIGLLLGCYAGGELLATPFVGGIADRLGRRPVLLVSSTGIGLGFLLLHFSRGVPAIAAALLIIGIFESVLHPTAAAVLADLAVAGDLRRHYALTRMASNAGQVIGPALGALIVQRSLGLVFVGSAVAMLLGAAMVATLMLETRITDARTDEEDDDGTAFLTLFRDRNLAALLLPLAILGIATSWVDSVLPLYAANARTLTPSGIGLLFTWAAALGVVFGLPAIRITANMSGFSIVAISGGALVLAFGSLVISAALPSLVLAVSLVSFAALLAGPLVQSIVSELAPKHSRAIYMAAFSSAIDVQDAAGPAIGTALYAGASTLPWLAGVPLTLGASLVLAVATRRHEAVAE